MPVFLSRPWARMCMTLWFPKSWEYPPVIHLKKSDFPWNKPSYWATHGYKSIGNLHFCNGSIPVGKDSSGRKRRQCARRETVSGLRLPETWPQQTSFDEIRRESKAANFGEIYRNLREWFDGDFGFSTDFSVLEFWGFLGSLPKNGSMSILFHVVSMEPYELHFGKTLIVSSMIYHDLPAKDLHF